MSQQKQTILHNPKLLTDRYLPHIDEVIEIRSIIYLCKILFSLKQALAIKDLSKLVTPTTDELIVSYQHIYVATVQENMRSFPKGNYAALFCSSGGASDYTEVQVQQMLKKHKELTETFLGSIRPEDRKPYETYRKFTTAVHAELARQL